jgi:hypothetical protein
MSRVGNLARLLWWLAGLALALMPVIWFLGRPRRVGCDPPPPDVPCDPGFASPLWVGPAFWSIALLAFVLLLAAGLVQLKSRSCRRRS